MRGTLVLVIVVGCANQMPTERARWPDHRKREEARIDALEAEVKELSARLAALERHPVAQPPEPAAPPPPPAQPPQALERDMIAATIQQLVPAIRACGAGIPTKGTVKVLVKVDPDGHVTEASILDTPDKLMGECVAGVVRGATFPKTATGGQFSYPFVF